VALASIGWQLVLSSRTPVPSEDGVSYLWMAQQFAGGGWRDALAMVFPPGFPLLCSPWVALGLPAEAVGIGCGVVCTGATLWPLARIAEHVRAGAGLPTAVLFAASPLLPRVAVEVYSEPPFLLAIAWGTWCASRRCWWAAGAWAGIAFWIRPEGALLPVAFLLAGHWQAWRGLVPVALAVAALAALRAAAGHGFDPLPILSFHELRDDLPGRGDVLTNVLAVPGAWFEGFGGAGILAAAALIMLAVPRWRRGVGRGAGPLAWQVVLQIVVTCSFVVRRRFLLSAAVSVHALAGVALEHLAPRKRVGVLVACVIGGVIPAFRGTIDADRTTERELGSFLGARLDAGHTIHSNLPRVVWFAGRRPPPPRHFETTQHATMAAADDVEFVVFSESGQRLKDQRIEPLLTPRYARCALPESLAEACRTRSIAVFARR
jgi:hypothetical protein